MRQGNCLILSGAHYRSCVQNHFDEVLLPTFSNNLICGEGESWFGDQFVEGAFC